MNQLDPATDCWILFYCTCTVALNRREVRLGLVQVTRPIAEFKNWLISGFPNENSNDLDESSRIATAHARIT